MEQAFEIGMLPPAVACAMLLCVTALAAKASGNYSDEENDSIAWTLDSSKLTISGYRNMANHVKTLSVLLWKAYSSPIKSIYVSERSFSLGTYAFYGYQSLSGVAYFKGNACSFIN